MVTITPAASMRPQALQEVRVGRVAVVDLAARAGGTAVTACRDRGRWRCRATPCRSSMSHTTCPTRPWPTTMACPCVRRGGTTASCGSTRLAASPASAAGAARRCASTGISAMVSEVTASVKLADSRRRPGRASRPGRCRRRRTRRRGRAAGPSRPPPATTAEQPRQAAISTTALMPIRPTTAGQQPAAARGPARASRCSCRR